MFNRQQLMDFVGGRLGDDSQTIVDEVSGARVEYHDIPLVDLEALLNKRGLMRQIDQIIATTDNTALKDGLIDFKAHLMSRSVNLDVRDDEVRAKFLQVLAALTAVLPDEKPTFDQIRGLGIENYTLADRYFGGAVTAADVDDAKQRVALVNGLNKLFHDAGAAIMADGPAPATLADVINPLLV